MVSPFDKSPAKGEGTSNLTNYCHQTPMGVSPHGPDLHHEGSRKNENLLRQTTLEMENRTGWDGCDFPRHRN